MGLQEYMLDSIQKDMLAYNNMISPPYFPQGIPVEVDGKWIFVIVARTGQQRPYKSPEHVTSKKDKKYNYYIRYQTSSVKANSEQELEKNGSPRAEFFTDEDRRAMRIRIPVHSAFLENNDEVSASDGYEKATNKLSKKKMEQYDKILKLMDDGDWHKTAEIAENLGLKDTRTKELLKELVGLEKLVDNGKTKGKMYKLK